VRANLLPSFAERAALADVLAFVRFSTLGVTVLIAFLGVASAAEEPTIRSVATVAAVAALFHVFAYVLNDSFDLELDRTEPRRQRTPLVRGKVSLPAAAVVVAVAASGALVLTAAGASEEMTVPAAASMAAAIVGLGMYDVLGKRTPWPPITDLVQGAGWASLLVAGAWLAGGPTQLTAILAAYVVVLVVLVNGVHGAVRDLKNDLTHGVLTTASLLGAQAGPPDSPYLPRRLLVYAWALQALLIGLATAALGVSGIVWPSAPALMLVILNVGAVLLLAAASLASESRSATLDPGVNADLFAAAMLHMLVALAVPIALVSARTVPWLVIVMTAGYLLPLVGPGWLSTSWRWAATRMRALFRVPLSRTLDLATLTRPHNCLAAGFAVMIGARLGGVPDLLAEPVLRASAVAMLTVAASNVVNDRADVVEDRINNPGRPIAADRVSMKAATVLAFALGSAAVLVALSFGAIPAAAACSLLGAGVAYSEWVRRAAARRSILVAGLAAATIPFGALVLGRPSFAVAVATALVFLSVLSSEILGAIGDRDGDAAAGRITIGTRLSVANGLRLHALLTALIIGLVIFVIWLGAAASAFFWASVLGVIAPSVILLTRLRGGSQSAVLRSMPVAKAAWFTGLCAIAFLV
jgi:4-hydroxybenzoate polyprenyltransferase